MKAISSEEGVQALFIAKVQLGCKDADDRSSL